MQPLAGLRALVAVAALLLTLIPWPAAASGGWEIVSQQAEATFSSSLELSLRVRAPEPIVEVILFYGRTGDRIVRRIYPSFRPASELSLSHRELLERGQYAPGTELHAWWQLTDRSGTRFETPEQIIQYDDGAQDWEMLAGDGVRLYHYGVRASQAQGWVEAAEASLEHIASTFGVAPTSDLHIYVYRSERDMRSALATRSDDYDERVTTLGVAVDEDTLILLEAQPDLEATMAHELTHLVVGMATDNPYAGLPRWLDEGLAMVAEGELPRQNELALRRGISDDDLLSVRSMTSYSGRADQVDLYYGECYSVVRFMIETYGREDLSALLDAFSVGALQDDALEGVYGFDVEELDALWRESLGLKRRESALAAPELAAR
ncbi:MAG: hypothetical protein GXX94_01735 [Chloroflexi bacterium]|nr:hypothetical protein [Chloroflexota bacterium]